MTEFFSGNLELAQQNLSEVIPRESRNQRWTYCMALMTEDKVMRCIADESGTRADGSWMQTVLVNDRLHPAR